MSPEGPGVSVSHSPRVRGVNFFPSLASLYLKLG